MAHLSFKRRTCAILVAIFFLTYIYQQIRITRRPFRMPGAEHGYAKTAQSLYSGHKKSDLAFLVKTKGCYIPGFTHAPLPSARKRNASLAVRKLKTRKSWKPQDPNFYSWATQDGTVMHFRLGRNYSKPVKCCLRDFTGFKVNDWSRITHLKTAQKCISIQPSKPRSIHKRKTVLLQCSKDTSNSSNSATLLYQQLHINVPVIRNLRLFWETFKRTSKTSLPPSLILIGIDGLSHSSLQAHLPKSFSILTSRNEPFTQFKGYASLGNSSPLENLITLLTGKSYAYWKQNCNPDDEEEAQLKSTKCKMDALWNYFRTLKYETLLAEEFIWKIENPKTMFVYHRPTSNYFVRIEPGIRIHTLNEFQVAQQFLLHSTKQAESVTRTERIFDFALNFYRKMSSKSIPTFSFLWFKEYLRNAKEFDDILSKFLERLLFSTNTFVILVGGRGSPAGMSEAFDFQLKLEEVLPALFIRLPPDLRQKEPGLNELLQLNSARLTTPFDLHETLKTIISLGVNSLMNSGIEGIEKELGTLQESQLEWVKLSGLSLISQEVSSGRNCERAHIPITSCPCSDDPTLTPSGSYLISTLIAEYGLAQANTELNQDTEFKSLCTEWSFDKLVNARRTTPKDDKELEDVELSFTANPAAAKFEIQCRFWKASQTFTCETSTFTRLSSADPQESYCIEKSRSSFDPSFCYCNEI